MKTPNWTTLVFRTAKLLKALEPVDVLVRDVKIKDQITHGQVIITLLGIDSLAGQSGNIQITINQKRQTTVTVQGALKKTYAVTRAMNAEVVLPPLIDPPAKPAAASVIDVAAPGPANPPNLDQTKPPNEP